MSELEDSSLGSAEEPLQTCVTLTRSAAGGVVSDTTIDSAAPTTNYGSSSTLVASPTSMVLAQYDLSSVPPGATVISALAKFSEATSGAGTLSLNRALSPWSEGNVTWSSFQGALDPLPASTRSNPTGMGQVGFPIANLVQQWLDGTYPNYGFAVQQSSGTTTVYSSETTTAAVNRPQLLLCYSWTSCNNGVMDAGETGVDCGGPCAACSADLAGLSLSFGELQPSFNAATTAYTATVGFLATRVSVGASLQDPLASLSIQGVPVASGGAVDVTLAEGANGVDVVATSQDGTSKSYTLSIDRGDITTLRETSFIKSATPQLGAAFGTMTALKGNYLAVGSRYEDGGAVNSGAAYVFERNSQNVWTQAARLTPPHADQDDVFGHTVRLSGDTLVVASKWEDADATGTAYNDNNNMPDSGAAYVFQRDAQGNWNLQDYLKASNPGVSEEFSYSIDIWGDTIAVGARFEDSDAQGNDGAMYHAGAVYIFERDSAGNWNQTAFLKAHDASPNSEFGYSVAIQGDTVVVGSILHSTVSSQHGTAYVFQRDAQGAWSETATLMASNPGPADAFGATVALDGDTIAVGARSEDGDSNSDGWAGSNNNAPNSGAVYVFVQNAQGQWLQQAYLKQQGAAFNDGCADALGVAGDTVAVGCLAKGTTGAVIVFTRNAAGQWSQVKQITPHNAGSGDHFGHSLSLDIGRLAVGARNESSDGGGLGYLNNLKFSGAEYIFDISSCADGVLGDVESSIDCGGACGGCASGLACYAGVDCASGTCNANVCQ